MKFFDLLLDTPPRRLYQSLFRRLFSDSAIAQFDDAHPCVFVLSTGRVGSMTLASLLSLAKNIVAVHEPKPSLYSLSKAAFQYQSDIAKDIWDDMFISLREEQLTSALRVGKGYVETSPQGTFLAPIISRVVPNVKFIYLVRHPAEVVISGMKRGWYAGHPADATRIQPPLGSGFYSNWQDATPFHKNVWQWTETNSWIMSFIGSLPTSRVLMINAENLYAGNEKILHQLFNFCGAKVPARSKIEKILSLKLNSQRSGAFPEIERWPAEDYNFLRKVAGDVANDLGYPLNLPEVH